MMSGQDSLPATLHLVLLYCGPELCHCRGLWAMLYLWSCKLDDMSIWSGHGLSGLC